VKSSERGRIAGTWRIFDGLSASHERLYRYVQDLLVGTYRAERYTWDDRGYAADSRAYWLPVGTRLTGAATGSR